MNKYSVGLIAFVFFIACDSSDGNLFKNPTPEDTGLEFVNSLNEKEELNILDYLYFYNGGGVAIGDINGDELPDIYLSGNQVKNKLYLNKGNLQFEDITEKAGVAGNSTWNTGSVMGDINGDGLLDIYVCAVVGINGFNGHNELFINNGDATFSERSAEYGLDFDTYSSSAAFLDYDLDGDLDLYLLNHAVHTQESFGKADLRFSRHYQSGDKLLRNDGGSFKDVSEEAGIYGGVNSYGLGVAVSDFNQDGFPDLYIGNDFHEDDYYYLNNGDGTFKECLKEYFGHTTRFSMGNDVSDINHDGWPDIMSLDMLPEDEKVLKSSEGDDDVQTQKLRVDLFGYHYQFTRNMLYLNAGGRHYTETALQSGVAATDWSWSALFADYDQDGEQDLFIANGIPKRPNDLDYIKFISNEQIKKKINNTRLVDQQALDMMPSGAISNYYFSGGPQGDFVNKSASYIKQDTLISGATAMGDLDNDGDLDIITNNINTPASLYINKTDDSASYLKLKFNYRSPNKIGIGTKVYSYHDGILQYKELYTVRGFQASSEPILHFGYGKEKMVDSLRIVWPDKTSQLLTGIQANQTLTISPHEQQPFDYASLRSSEDRVFKKIEGALGIDFKHTEDNYIDFNRQKLIPYKLSDRGPGTAIGDLNGDGKEDIYFGGSRSKPSLIYLQNSNGFEQRQNEELIRDSIKEVVVVAIEDFDGNTEYDLMVGVGGADFFDGMNQQLNDYFLQREGKFMRTSIPDSFHNASVIKPFDYDNDGDLDVFIGNQSISNDFGNVPTSFLMENRSGAFYVVENKQLNNIGMVTDAIWEDFNNDGKPDLVIVGEWMAPKFFKNEKGKLKEVSLLDQQISGLWQSIEVFDIDKDGDKDFIIGNWGNNSKFTASVKQPLKMYYADFDNNGSTETIVALAKGKKYFPIEGLDGLATQMVDLRKQFTRYKDFAGKSISEIFDPKLLAKAKLWEVHELRSGYLINQNGYFEFKPFPKELQLSPITDFLVYDFDSDGTEEVLTGGNYFGVKPYHGRFDSFAGALIKDQNDIVTGGQLGLDFMQKSVRHLNIISMNERPYLLVTINNDEAQLYELTKHK
ncbi:MAG: VCBS repeat-containing protein [Flavobacteriaceae bacterium]